MTKGEMAKSKPERIDHPKVIFTEGVDAKLFCIWACQAFGFSDFHVIDFGGNRELPLRLQALVVATGFENVESLLVVRDAEDSAEDALRSVQGALEKANLPVPSKAFEIRDGNPRTAIAFFPGVDKNDKLISQGTLEDLCLATVKDQSILSCADAFVDCCEKNGVDMGHRHKMRLHAYLSGNRDFVGRKIGEASKANAWDWQHPRMKPFEDLLRNL